MNEVGPSPLPPPPRGAFHLGSLAGPALPCLSQPERGARPVGGYVPVGKATELQVLSVVCKTWSQG